MAAASPQETSAPVAADIESNRLTLLVRGTDRLAALIALIEGARESVRLLYYIFTEDDTGQHVRDALLAACSRGVKVRILVDGFGSETVGDDFFQPLVDQGCGFCRFEPKWGRRYLLRNHQKMALADGKVALIGGFNIEDSYFGPEDEGAWRDLGVRIEGPAAEPAAAYFDDLFAWARIGNARTRDLRAILVRHSQGDGRLRWLFGGPTRRLSPWAQSVKKDMEHARRFDLIAAYFAPGRGMLRRIGAIARRGKARIVTAALSDNGATIGAARHTYSRLLRRGVEIHEYRRTRLHTKLIVMDDVVHIGSANFDLRSFYLNLELMLRIEDPGFARDVRAYVDREIADSERITAEGHRHQRSLFNRIKWGLCYFIVATMDYNVSRRLNFGIRGG